MHLQQKVALYSIFAVSYTNVASGALRTYSGYRIFFVIYDVTGFCQWYMAVVTVGTLYWVDVRDRTGTQDLLPASVRPATWPRSRKNGSLGRMHSPRAVGASQRTSASISLAWDKLVFWKTTSHIRSKTATMSSSTDLHGGVIPVYEHRNDDHDLSQDSMTRPLAPEFVDTIMQPRTFQSDFHSRQEPYDIKLVWFASLPSDRSGERQTMPPVVLSEPARWSLRRVSLPFSVFSRPQRMIQDTRVKQYVWMPWERREVQEICPSTLVSEVDFCCIDMDGKNKHKKIQCRWLA